MARLPQRLASALRWTMTWGALGGGFALSAFYVVRLLGAHAEKSPYFEIIGRPRPHAVYSGLFVALVFAGAVRAGPYVLSHAAVWKRLTTLVLLGFGLQWGFLVSDGHGFTAMHKRLWDAGNSPAEFIGIVKAPLPPRFIERYDDLVLEHQWRYSKIKAPGMLYIYGALEKIAEGGVGRALGRIVEESDAPEPTLDDRISGVFFVAFPFLTFLTVVPLFYLARSLSDERIATFAALFFVLTPSAEIVVMFSDGAIHPLIATTGAALAVAGGTKRRWMTLLGGVALSLGCFVSFALLTEIGVIVAFLGVSGLLTPGASIERRIRAACEGPLLFCAGVVLLQGLLALAFHYHPIARLQIALGNFDAWEPPDRSLCKYYNFLQLAIWFGPPLSALVLLDLAHLATSSERTSLRACWAVGCVAALLYSTLRLTGEVMRLWLPMMPFLAVLAAASFRRIRESGAKWMLPAVVIVQIVTTFALLAHYES